MELFKIFAPTMIASRGEDGSMRIEGVASSTVRDHHGDQITRRGLEKMAQSAKGLTIFLNHEYKVPEDVFGTVERVKLERTGQIDKATGEEIYDLRFGIAVQKANPRAVQAFEQMEPGPGKVPTKLGLSIGAMIPDGGAIFDKSKGGRYIVDDLDLVETSLVSMPANPRSWVEYAVKSLSGKLPTELKKRSALAETLVNEGFTVVDGIDEEELVPAPVEQESEGTGVEMEGIEIPADGETHEVEVEGEEGAPEAEAVEEPAELTDEEALRLLADSTSPATTTEDDAEVDHEPVVEPKARVTVWDGDKVIEVDTGRAKPKAEDPSAQAEPENAGSPGGTTKAFEIPSDVTASIETSDRLLLALSASLKVKEAENEQLRSERDAALAMVAKTLEGTEQVLQKLANTPMGRKTGYVEASESFAQIRDDIYDADVRKMLKR